jgi:hypothetical protein
VREREREREIREEEEGHRGISMYRSGMVPGCHSWKCGLSDAKKIKIFFFAKGHKNV